MRKRPLGKTGLEVAELGLGTFGLSGEGYGPVVEAEVSRVIDRALVTGITLFETSDSYGRGAMETLLGKRLPAHASQIVTKLGTDRDGVHPQKRFEVGYLRGAFERSQERLGRDTIDVVLLHNPTVTAMARPEPFELLKELQRRGLIGAWGVSAGSVEVARGAMAHGAGVLELAYNVFAAGDLHELASDVESNGVGVLARSVLAHGLLAAQWSVDREFYEGDHRRARWTREELRRRVSQLDALRPLVSGSAIASVRAAALRFVLCNNVVSCAVLGPRSQAQLDQLVREAGWGPPYLRDTALAELAARLRGVGITL